MVKGQPVDAKMVWHELWSAMRGVELAFRKRGDSEEQRGLLPLQRVSGLTYTLAKNLMKLGIDVEIPQDVLDRCESKIIAIASTPPEVHNAIKTMIEAPITIGGGILSGAKAAVGKVFSALKVTPKEEEIAKEEG